jgi:hypothetical protein
MESASSRLRAAKRPRFHNGEAKRGGGAGSERETIQSPWARVWFLPDPREGQSRTDCRNHVTNNKPVSKVRDCNFQARKGCGFSSNIGPENPTKNFVDSVSESAEIPSFSDPSEGLSRQSDLT